VFHQTFSLGYPGFPIPAFKLTLVGMTPLGSMKHGELAHPVSGLGAKALQRAPNAK